MAEQAEDKRISLSSHLDELRIRLIRCLVVIVLVTFACLAISEYLMELAAVPVMQVFQDLGYSADKQFLLEIQPGEGMMARLKLSLYAGLLLSSAYLFYEIWSFVSVGLHKHEKRFVYLFGPLIVGSFIVGTLFTYFMVLPYGLYFLLKMNPVWIQGQYSVQAYLSTLISLALAFGLVFELPLVMMFISRLGIVDWRWYAKYRRPAYFSCFVVGAFLTPPDVFTQMMMAIPMLLLYETGIQLSKLNIRKLIGAEPAPEDDDTETSDNGDGL